MGALIPEPPTFQLRKDLGQRSVRGGMALPGNVYGDGWVDLGFGPCLVTVGAGLHQSRGVPLASSSSRLLGQSSPRRRGDGGPPGFQAGLHGSGSCQVI